MSVHIKLPQVNAHKFSKSFMLRAIIRAAQIELWPFLDQVGPDRFKKMIAANKPFISSLDFNKMPDSWKSGLSQAPQYDWMLNLFDERDYYKLIPGWLVDIVGKDEQGRAWFANEVATVKSFFTRRNNDPAKR